MLNPLHENTTLKIVDGRGADPTADIKAAADNLRNFIIILQNEKELDKLWRALGTTDFVPERLRRWGILAMAEVLKEEDYTRLLGLYRENAIYLVEQLSLQRNVPPAPNASCFTAKCGESFRTTTLSKRRAWDCSNIWMFSSAPACCRWPAFTNSTAATGSA